MYNHGPDGYHAEFLFRSRQSFTDDLDKLFQNLKTKWELKMTVKEKPDDDEREDIEDQLEELEASTSNTLETLRVLFGVTEDELGSISAHAFLEAHPLGLLGTTVAITESNLDIFITKIKPLLDSTPANHGGKTMMLWPLIERATIYLKSDFLKNGIQLVDLPGLGDAVQCRSRVAEQFTKYLDITAVVTPAHRATEEKTAIGFIRRRQEDEMRMNGKFDRDSLCVVLSKSEDLDLNDYLKEGWIARDHPNIKKHLDRSQMLDKIVRKADSGVDGSESGTVGIHTAASVSKNDELEADRREFFALRESLKQAAVDIRNRSVSDRIQEDFRERRKAIKSPKHEKLFDDTIEVFPTSARAFQAIRHPGGVIEAGFPHERHTGIPRLKQWLTEATFEKREKHLDRILNRLSKLFGRLETWISVNETPAEVPAYDLHELQSIHDRNRRVRIPALLVTMDSANVEQSLTTLLRHCCEDLRQIDPMKKKGPALSLCQKEYPSKIDRWRYRYPDRTSDYKLHGNVQNCILRKQGDYHKSKGKFPYEYQWIDDLYVSKPSLIFVQSIVCWIFQNPP